MLSSESLARAFRRHTTSGIRDRIAQHVLPQTPEQFPRQRAWESVYMEEAAKSGTLLVWLSREVEHHCEKAYGSMTLVELGIWMTEYKYRQDKPNICIGTDGRFSEWKTFSYDLAERMSGVPIHTTLTETCEATLAMIRRRYR